MEVDVEAVYIRDSDINLRGNTLLTLCYAIQKQYPGEVLGAQLVNGYWSVYMRSNNSRAAIIINGFNINDSKIKVHDNKPFLDGGKGTERVVIKDLPATTPPDRVLAYLKGFPHITTRSRVLYAKERIGGEELSPFINGDRIIYINADVSPPLPKETVICGHHCRIWHPSQKNYCKRCASHGHRTIDVDVCDSYEPDCLVSAWRGDKNPLSNFYICDLSNGDFKYKSSEHFYQHEFCVFMNRPDIARQVYDSPTPKDAKLIASHLKVPQNAGELAEWDKIKLSVMEYISRVKWNCCAKFRQALLSTEGMVIAEATSCDYWGVGVAPNLAQHTKASKFLGRNHMGKIQMALRCHVSQPDILNDNCEITLPMKPVYHRDESDTFISELLDSLLVPIVPPVQRNSSEDNTGAPDSIQNVRVNPPPSTGVPCTNTDDSTLTTDVTNISSGTEDNSSTSDIKMDCATSESQPLPSTSGFIPPPIVPPRKKISRVGRSSCSAKNINTLDNFVTKESPSCKRKPSGDAGSPSSTQTLKSTRTDGADTVS